MTVLVGEKGRNRIAAPTHGHEWRAGSIAQSKRHMVAATRDVGKENTIYTHEGHTLKGTRQVVIGRDGNSIASSGHHSCSWAPLITRRKKMTPTLNLGWASFLAHVHFG
jgi:hypothetical protein